MHCKSVLGKRGGRVYSVSPDDTLGDAAATMSDRRIGALLILDGAGGLAGILSERDVTRAMARHRGDAAGLKVAQFMTAEVVTCSPEDDLEQAMSLMQERHVRHLPVIAHGKPVGMISVRDVIETLLEATAEERDQIREYVAAATC